MHSPVVQPAIIGGRQGVPPLERGLILPGPDEVLAHLMSRRLRDFTKDMWPVIEPGVPYKSNWHIDAISEKLEAVTAGEILRLIINVPPRHMKSTTVAVAWPAWEWLTDPTTQFLFASYAARLSTRDSIKCRRVVESLGGRQVGGTLMERIGYRGILGLLGADWKLTGDQNEKTRFENSMAGYRLATSLTGTATGEGGKRIVVDDPHKAADVESQTKRETVIDWLDGTMSTRLNDPATGSVVVVMQRLHEQDATGHLLSQGGWEHLCLPAEYDPKHPFTWPDDPRVKAGELLWPRHFGADEVADLKKKLGSRRASGQLQQNPTPSEGGMFKRDWWKRYPPGDEWEGTLHLGWDHVVQSWDMRFKDDKASGDYVVGQLWGFHGANAYLLGQIRGRLGFTESQQAMRDLTTWSATSKYGPFRPDFAKLVEEKANGSAIIQTMHNEVGGIVPLNPTDSKQSRAAAVTPLVEAGNVFLPPGDWIPCPPGYEPTSTADFIEEHAGFPLGSHDDQVDALSQVLAWQRPQARAEKVERPRQQATHAASVRGADRAPRRAV